MLFFGSVFCSFSVRRSADSGKSTGTSFRIRRRGAQSAAQYARNFFRKQRSNHHRHVIHTPRWGGITSSVTACGRATVLRLRRFGQLRNSRMLQLRFARSFAQPASGSLHRPLGALASAPHRGRLVPDPLIRSSIGTTLRIRCRGAPSEARRARILFRKQRSNHQPEQHPDPAHAFPYGEGGLHRRCKTDEVLVFRYIIRVRCLRCLGAIQIFTLHSSLWQAPCMAPSGVHAISSGIESRLFAPAGGGFRRVRPPKAGNAPLRVE